MKTMPMGALTFHSLLASKMHDCIFQLFPMLPHEIMAALLPLLRAGPTLGRAAQTRNMGQGWASRTMTDM